MMLYFILEYFIYTVVFIQSVNARWHKYSVVENVRYGDVIGQHVNTSRIKCLVLCDGNDECVSVNHNADMGTCEFTAHVPRVLTPPASNEPNWRVYFNDRIIPGVDAWQKSTMTHMNIRRAASYAIDGDRNNNDPPLLCAHSRWGYAFWGMEFERVTEVSHVLMFFRNNPNFIGRNTNMRLRISSTREESNGDIGTDCAVFVGPPSSVSEPTKVTCTPPVTGKFLKITQNNNAQMCLCEVEVYSV